MKSILRHILKFKTHCSVTNYMASQERLVLWEQVLHRIARENGLSNPRWEFDIGSKIGDNFVCELLRCTMIDKIDPTKSIHLMIKVPPRSEVHRIRYRVDEFFKCEAAMYENVLPALAEVFKESKLLEADGVFPNTARIYGVRANAGDDALIVMEDLGRRGYIMQDKKDGLNESHCRLVLQRLARLHASSMALQVKNPQLHEKLVGQLKERVFARQVPQSYFEAMKACRNLINERFPEGTKEREKFENFAQRQSEILLESTGKYPPVCCITHGDLWINNILFKYKDGCSEPDDLCFLDFQVARMASPILDLSYLFCMCARKEGRKSFHSLIKSYYVSLSKTLSDVGLIPDSILSWDLFQEQVRQFFKFGWAVAVRHLPTAFLDVKGLEDFHKALFDSGKVTSTFTLPQDTKDLTKVLGDLLQDLVELGFM